MKKLVLVIFGCVMIVPGYAIQKCVALVGGTTTCSSNYEEYDYKLEWGATCVTNGTTVSITGVGGCSNEAGSLIGDVYVGALPTGSSSKAKLNCWCKMISPAISPWVYLTEYDSTELCVADCARYCAYKISIEADLRYGLFYGLSD